jgi:hypothetical protein
LRPRHYIPPIDASQITLMSLQETARRLSISPRWLRDHWRETGGTRAFGKLKFFKDLVAQAFGFGLILDKPNGKIYFIQAKSGGLIKIGFSIDLKRRLRTLQSHSPLPLKIVGSMDGSLEMEKEIHGKFNKTRERGEWFYPSEKLIKFIGFYDETKLA